MAQNQSGRAHKIFALCAMASCAAWPWLVANAPGSGRLSDDPPAQTQPNSDATQPNVDDPAASQPQTATTLRKEPGALASDGQAFTIGGFDLRYLRQHPQHPAIAELLKTDVDLGWTYQGYVAPREGVPTVRISVGDAENRETEVYYASALQHVLEALRDRLNKDFGLMGVYVAPDPKDVDASGNDLRAPSDRVMNIVISTAIVTDMRTLASGERVSEDGPITPEDRIDNPVHRRILLRSPIQPFIPPTDVANKSILEANKDDAARAARADLLNKNTLDDYLYFLSRHPGRRVDAAVSPAEEAGGVILDYHVTENRPLVLYAQASNTGTPSTGRWRERFGLLDTQLTNHDDILSIDYITAEFDTANAVLASYEAPFENDRIRWRVFGGWNEYNADEVGFFNDDFHGENWNIGGELRWNFFQKRDLFVDLVGGVRYEHISVDNRGFDIQGDAGYIIPSVGLELEQNTEWYSTLGSLGVEWWTTNANDSELEALGRTAPDSDFMLLQGNLTQSIYLEPLLNRRAWEDPTSEKQPTLAHELLASVRGQYAFDNRLVPQAEDVLGGLYTIRGYPESATAGDSMVMGSLEYRLHVPRLFGVEAEPRELFGRTFRYAPQYVYGLPDWDLVLKAFVDAGQVWNSDRLGFETDDTLVGAGIGFEVYYRRNFSVRVDWGFALKDLESAGVDAGDNRVHFVGTIVF